jgi:hypothetical protein
MVNVFLNNGRQFEEISIEAAVSAKVITDTTPEFNGSVLLVCLNYQGREVARFKWADVSGYAID